MKRAVSTLAGLLLLSCTEGERYVRVELSGREDAQLDAVAVVVRLAKEGHAPLVVRLPRLPEGGLPSLIEFPTDLVVLIGDFAGMIEAVVDAVGLEDRTVASGRGGVGVQPGGEGQVGTIEVVLAPGGGDGGFDGGPGGDAGDDAGDDAGAYADAGPGCGPGNGGGDDAGAYADAGPDDAGPHQCGDGIPVPGELCFEENLSTVDPPEFRDVGIGAGGGQFAVGDDDGDGNPDLLFSGSTDRTLVVMVSHADGRPEDWDAWRKYEDTSRTRALLLTNLDTQDEDDEVALLLEGSPNSVVLAWYDAEPLQLDPAGEIQLLAAARLVSGQPPRLVMAGPGILAVQTADGTPDVELVAGAPGSPVALAAGEIDDEPGDDVVLTTSEPDQAIVIYPGNGEGSFEPPILSNRPSIFAHVAVGDVQGGDNDEIVVFENEDRRVTILDLACGHLEESGFTAGFDLELVAVLDLDGQGKAEVVVAGEEQVEVWDVSGTTAELRLTLNAAGALQFRGALASWPRGDGGGQWVAPSLWTIATYTDEPGYVRFWADAP